MPPPLPPDSLKERLFAEARALGFARIGVARAEPLVIEGERLRAWLAAERHGVMAYMADSAAARVDPTLAHGAPGGPGLLPSAKSVIVLAMPYARGSERVAAPREAPKDSGKQPDARGLVRVAAARGLLLGETRAARAETFATRGRAPEGEGP